jgi:hypothetical protein
MGSLWTEFQAEIMEIVSGTKILLSKNVTRRKRHSCCGSGTAISAIAAIAALATLTKTSTISAVLWESIQGPEQLGGSNKN